MVLYKNDTWEFLKFSFFTILREVKVQFFRQKFLGILYTKGLSEEIAHKMRKHNIDVVHKPTATIKNILCSKAKDRLDPMDKPGAVYHIKCESHHVDYIGETGRQTKTRMYEHRVITHKDSKRSHYLLEEKVEEEVSWVPEEVKGMCRE